MKQMLLASVQLRYTTLATSRNLLDMVVPTDLADATRVVNTVYSLALNNNSLNNANSEVLLGAVTKFLHLSCSQEVEVTLRRTIDSVPVNLPILVTRHMTLTGSFTEVKIKNLNLTDPASIRAIFA
jgi:hypothetical protein